jgi:murein L,D-transpeptidase YcbB/YkuD
MIREVRFMFFCGLLTTAGCSASAPHAQRGQASQAVSAAAAPPETLSPAGKAKLEALLSKGRLEDLQWPNFSEYAAQVREFYERDGTALEWTREGKPTQQALQLIGELEQADRKGLDSRDYDAGRWAGRLQGLNASGHPAETTLVEFDLALTVSGMRYASDLHLGKIDPRKLHKSFEPDRTEYDLADFLRKRIAVAPDVGEAFKKIEPPYLEYWRALDALQKYLKLARDEQRVLLPTVAKPVAPGKPYAAVPQLVERLKFLGDLPVDTPSAAENGLYEGSVVEGVKHFQMRHGLDAAGTLGAQTIAELNRPMSDRVKQLQLALERWRWVPHNFEQPPIVVNIPEFVLRAYDEERQVRLTMRVVVGRALHTQTPVMEEDMKYVIFWPYWNVPTSIMRHEMLPKIVKNRAYLQKNGYEVTSYSGQVVTEGVVDDDVLAKLRAAKLMIRQKPGPKNALGLIKFIFPNDKNVYLHATPAQSLFSQSRRDFSHGCIRVEKPAALAEWVLRNNPGWTTERIDTALAEQKQMQVNLAKTIPVLIVYGTAVVAEDGTVYFFDDIYGLDKELDNLCCQAYTADK